jgi:KDO2-lipid IV(A) lauroyltransferase
MLKAVMPLTSRHRRALDNLALAFPEKTAEERERIARAMWMHLGRVTGEAFQIDRLMADDARVELPRDFERFRELGREGAISAALHLGNWEIAGVLPRRAGLPLAGVYQALHNPLVERYLKDMRAPAYPAGLYAKGPDLGRTVIRLARNGAGVGIVADLREMRGVGVLFFGQPAFATPLPAMLARASGRPIIAGAVIRTQGVRFRAVLEHVPVPRTDDRQRDVEEATQALHAVFERWIREAPEQWMWTHRKWARSNARTLTVREAFFPGPVDDPVAAESARTPPARPRSGA